MYPYNKDEVAVRRAGPSRGTTIVLVTLALLLMGSGIGLIFYTTVVHPAQLQAQATTARQDALTAFAHQVATANARTTQTAVAQANATATVNAQNTAVALATVTAQQQFYNQAISGTPIVNSSLSGQDGNTWDEGVSQDGAGGCTFTGGGYHAKSQKANLFYICASSGLTLRDFTLQVNMAILSGDGGGLLFRADNNFKNFYYLFLGKDSTYQLYAFKDADSHGGKELLADFSPIIHSGNNLSNLVTVIVKSSNISIYINKQFLASTSDSTYQSGHIALLAFDDKLPTEVAYSNLQIWSL